MRPCTRRARMRLEAIHEAIQIHEDAAAQGALYGSVAPTPVQEEENFWWGCQSTMYSMHTHTHTHTHTHKHLYLHGRTSIAYV